MYNNYCMSFSLELYNYLMCNNIIIIRNITNYQNIIAVMNKYNCNIVSSKPYMY